MNHFLEQDIRDEAVYEIAKKMAVAARTAPKGRGIDNIVITIVKKDGIKEISDTIKKMAEDDGLPAFFVRDANNILSASAMLLIGTKIEPLNLSPCGLCGFDTCGEKRKHPDVPCAFNTGDLGIAIGSAVSVAMDNRVDNRVMYTVGMAVLHMKLLGEDVKIVYGIPLSSASKNPYFDRQ